MVGSRHIVVGFFSFLERSGCFAGFVVFGHEADALHDNVGSVLGLAFDGVLDVA